MSTLKEASLALLDRLNTLSVQELESLVRYHNHLYFNLQAPQITDEAYDQLVEVLRQKHPNSPVLEAFEEVVTEEVIHQSPMLSLDKCYDEASFEKWRSKIRGPLWVMPKIDGVACSLIYNSKGELLRAATRGDGKKGENITQNVRQIKDIVQNLPQKALLNAKDTLEIRGEVYLLISRFKQHYEKDFANPRNLAAGALKQKDSSVTGFYGLSFYPYNLLGLSLETEQDKFEQLKQMGFLLPHMELLEEKAPVRPLVQFYEEARLGWDFETDGIVFRANASSEQDRLGATAHHPKSAIAYKFQGEYAQTTLKQVQWSLGRSGVITPVAHVAPVYISGAFVSKASLHNKGWFEKLGLCEGALVQIARRGGVIPQVERVLSAEGTPLLPPTHCPSCGQIIKEEGDFLYCSNPKECPDVILYQIEHFCKVLEIEGFGRQWIEILYHQNLLKEPAHLYELQKAELLKLPRMGGVLADKWLFQINQKRILTLDLFLTALGIPEVGHTIAHLLGEHFKTWENLSKAKEEELAHIHGVGKSIAQAFITGLMDREEWIKHLMQHITLVPKKAPNLHHPLSQKAVVFTGELTHMGRKEAQEKVRERGGTTPSSVTKECDFLVVGIGGETTSKYQKAQKINKAGGSIQMISEEEWLKML